MTNALLGGALIGLAAVWTFLSLGRVAGISGIFAQAIRPPVSSALWAIAFLVGLGVGGWIATAGLPVVSEPMDVPPALLLAGGIIVGIGTRLGSGCTSGHGVCGIARLSRRSIVATVVFVGVGMLTGTLVHGVLS